MNKFKTFNEFSVGSSDSIDETQTIGHENDLPNINTNEVQPGIGEDPILIKIRQFKATIEDYKKYWENKINEGHNPSAY